MTDSSDFRALSSPLLSANWVCVCVSVPGECACVHVLHNPLFEECLKGKQSTCPRVLSVVPLKPTVGLNKETEKDMI